MLQVLIPLQVGEALSVDCSYGSAGGRPAPSTTTADTRHGHPWLLKLVCGEGGRLQAASTPQGRLKTFKIQLISAFSGLCESSIEATHPVWHGDEQRTLNHETSTETEGEGVTEHDGFHESGRGHFDRLEQHLVRMQHSVFWEEVFETIKAEALVDGRHGWLAHHKRPDVSDSPMRGSLESMGFAMKRRLTNGGTVFSEQGVWGQVVHVMDDEVMVKMNNQYLLVYRLLPSDDVSEPRSKLRGANLIRSADEARTQIVGREGAGHPTLASLCKLALFYSASLLRQHQRIDPPRWATLEPRAAIGQQGEALPLDGPASSRITGGNSGRTSPEGSIWRSAAQVLRHLLFCKEVSP